VASRILKNGQLVEEKLHIVCWGILFWATLYYCNNYYYVSVAHWHSAHWAWNGYQPGLGSIPRPGRI